MKISSGSALKRKLTQTIWCRAYQWHFNFLLFLFCRHHQKSWSICDLILIYPVIRGNREYQFYKALKINLSSLFGQMVSKNGSKIYIMFLFQKQIQKNNEITNALEDKKMQNLDANRGKTRVNKLTFCFTRKNVNVRDRDFKGHL